MKILINASNIGQGGATQVTDSICHGLYQIPEVDFVVVLAKSLAYLKEELASFRHVEFVLHNISRNKWVKITGREPFLDDLVSRQKIDCVLSIFGPTWWIPRCPHVAGFALAHLVTPESPFFQRMGRVEWIKSKVHNMVIEFFYRRCSRIYYTENPMITERLQKRFRHHKVFTITNYYNQVYDYPEKWERKPLPKFDGCTMLTLAASYPHKNLGIAIPVAQYLHDKYPSFSFRFVFSIKEEEYPGIPDNLKEHFLFIGQVPIRQCPSLYQQATIVFQPTLLECFTAAYPEAMVMERPIVTTSLAFAKGLCGDAALYYSATSHQEAAECIYTLANDESLYKHLVSCGKIQLNSYDTYNERVIKLVSLCSQIVANK